jgi:ferrous iron transport protein B
MATRVIENRRDRFATILVAPLMSCSARLPVYGLVIGTFLTQGYPGWFPGLVLFAMYLIGFVVAPLVALLLKRTLLRGETPVFVMELPAYKRPTLRGVVRRVWDAGFAFVWRAGTIILAAMVLVWALLYFPNTDAAGTKYDDRVAAAEAKKDEAEAKVKEAAEAGREAPADAEQALADAEAETNAVGAEWVRDSILGRAGRALEPVFAPLGWDWKVGVAALASFPAREVVVGTLGIIYSQGKVDEDEQRQKLGDAIKGDWAADPVRGRYGAAVGLSIMVFFALCSQCVSTLAVIRRETRSWAWPAFTFAYMTALAYLGALLTFQVGRLITDALA